ncbi:MAG: fatty acid desaturase family protein [Myxococcota bacterium]|jgi:fatty acid desaturase|nr:fatty acid desaturase family protein [Myxococcota bacterium]
MSATAAEALEPRNWRDALGEEEVRELQRLRDGRGLFSLALNWTIIFGSFGLVAAWTNPLTILVAIFLIGGRQLGLAIFMHDASHYALFGNRRFNDWAGNWLAAYPIWGDLAPYRPYHLRHHAHTWTEKDPDLSLATPFPVSRESLRRKIWRDLSGQTGWKRAVATWRRDLERSHGKVRRTDGGGIHRLKGVVVSNAVIFGILAAAGHPEFYGLWVVAWLTSYSFAMRVRAIAEHSMPSDRDSEFGNTRTVLPAWWERLLLAPNRVNYHLEHHLLMRVPHYNLPRMHERLRERGVLNDALVVRGYLGILRQAASKQAV